MKKVRGEKDGSVLYKPLSMSTWQTWWNHLQGDEHVQRTNAWRV